MALRDPYFDASEDIPVEAEPRRANVDEATDARSLPGAPGPGGSPGSGHADPGKVGGQKDMARRQAQVKDYMDRLTAGHTIQPGKGPAGDPVGDVGMPVQPMGWQPERMKTDKSRWGDIRQI